MGGVVQLPGGIRVGVDAFLAYRPYLGVIEGRPGPKMNARELDGLRRTACEQWGDRATVLVPPKADARGMLPGWLCGAWLKCDEACALGEGEMASELVLLWAQDAAPGVEAIPPDVLGAVDWRAQARNFDW